MQHLEDLYYRIHVYPIEVPPLRAHRSDIPVLCRSFIERLNGSSGKRILDLAPEATHCLMDFCWPGNVRQLENAIEHAFVSCVPPRIELDDLPPELRTAHRRAAECQRHPSGSDVPDVRRNTVTREALLGALESAGWNQSGTARLLGVDRTTVWRQMHRWKIPNTPPDQSEDGDGQG
jgi:DNA-binding NtrC family response regulator